jgi:hypothetical protein
MKATLLQASTVHNLYRFCFIACVNSYILLVFLPSAQLHEACAIQLKHQCQSLKSINLFEGPYLLLDVTYSFSVDAAQCEEQFLIVFYIFLFCLEKVIWNPCMHKES